GPCLDCSSSGAWDPAASPLEVRGRNPARITPTSPEVPGDPPGGTTPTRGTADAPDGTARGPGTARPPDAADAPPAGQDFFALTGGMPRTPRRSLESAMSSIHATKPFPAAW